MEKLLNKLVDSLVEYRLASGSVDGVVVKNIAIDSRKVAAGAVFFALPGVHVDGSRFIAEALSRGACAIVTQNVDLQSLSAKKSGGVPNVPVIVVKNVREALWRFSCAFFNDPSHHLITIGVTGTEGKSSTVSFIWQLLRLCGKKAGFISTVEYSLGGDALPNPEHQTTPESPTVQSQLCAMAQNGCEYAVIEASSHGLSNELNRLGGVDFDVAIFMNVTEEHLEFHKTFEKYRDDKANLFRALDASGRDSSKNGTADNSNLQEQRTHKKIVGGTEKKIAPFGIVNLDDPSASYFANSTTAPCYGFTKDASIPNTQYLKEIHQIKDVADKKDSLSFQIDNTSIQTHLNGAFNSYNITAALIAVSHLLQKDFSEVASLAEQLVPIKGRMTEIECGQNFRVIVDYAHTPSSFMAIMPSIKKNCYGRVIAVFGSGGERDRVKRPVQGEIAGKYCDTVILSDEDPRGEDPVCLLQEIAEGSIKAGMTLGENLFIIHDRRAGIQKAFSIAKGGDVVLLLGKSHENSIIYKDGKIPWDEIAVAKELLSKMPH